MSPLRIPPRRAIMAGVNGPFAPLRNIDAAPIEHEGETFIAMSDPSGYVEDQLVLTPAAFFVAAMLDGHNTQGTIQEAFRAQFRGADVAPEQIQEIVDYLDDHGFLHNRQFEAMRDRVDGEFAASDTRPAYFAGRSYPEDPAALRVFIDGFFTGEGGPGPIAPEIASGAILPGLIVPHIDFHRGQLGYAHGYKSLYARGRPDVVFVFGVAHAGAPEPVVLTRKHFDTPFGTIETDTAIVDRLVAECSFNPLASEAVHRTEHSIEFQAVMLAYLYGTNVKMVPILCAGFLDDPEESTPAGNQPLHEFLEACQRIVAEPERRCAVIAAADLAHVGRRFGDPFDIDEGIVEGVAGRDREDLNFVLDGPINAEGFYASVMKDENRRNVCGLNCIYATLKALDGTEARGAMKHYGYAHDPAGGIVSFASVSIE